MHADAFYRSPQDRDGGLAAPLGLAVALHLLVALLFWAAWLWSPQRQVEAAAGTPASTAPVRASPASTATTTDSASVLKYRRAAGRVSENPKPSVPSVR